MAEITPTPRAGTWLRIDAVTYADTTPRAGTWLRIDAVTYAARRPRTSVGILVVGAGVSSS